MQPLAYYVQSTHVLGVTLVDTDGAPVTNAMVSATMVDNDGEPVVGQSWPLALPHSGGGVYQGLVSHELAVAHDDNMRYWMQVTAVRGPVQRYAEGRVIIEIDRD